MKNILDCLGCVIFMLGLCTPDDSVMITSLLLAAGSLILCRYEIAVWIWKRSSCLQRLFPVGHDSLFLSSHSRKEGQ